MKSKKELLKTMSETLDLLQKFDDIEEKESKDDELWYVDQPVIWSGYKRYLSSKNKFYRDGCTSETNNGINTSKFITPNYDAPNILVFIPNDGTAPVLPDDCIGLTLRIEGNYCNIAVESLHNWKWDIGRFRSITHYCILREPVSLKD